MSWIRKSPFGRGEDPLKHMVSLLEREAASSGIALSEIDKNILAGEHSIREPIPTELHEKAKQLIAQIFQRERGASAEESTKSFRSSIEWAEDQNYPNIVAIAVEVITGGGFGPTPRLRGRAGLKDRLNLIGCACLAVFFMFLIVVAISFFDRK